MTGKAFLKRLSFQLDFLMPEDRKTVLSYYEKKLAEITDSEEEATAIKAFGSPEHIAQKLKEDFLNKKNNMSSPLITETVECALNTIAEEDCSETDEGELIFSKPPVSANSPEYIHSLENSEIPSLYGEKVVIEDRKKPIEEIDLEPLDKANGLTPEEIEMAKAKTLKKADEFETDQKPVNTDLIDNDLKSFPQDDSYPNSKLSEMNVSGIAIELDDENETHAFTGIFKKFLGAVGITGGKATLIIVLFSIIASPLILFAFGLSALLYVFLMAVSAVLAVLSFALIAGLLVAGVIELVYGVAMLFDTISVALIELGLGTVLFSFVIAISAMIYEFLFGVLPRTIKWLTKKFIHYMKLLFCYLYGGNA